MKSLACAGSTLLLLAAVSGSPAEPQSLPAVGASQPLRGVRLGEGCCSVLRRYGQPSSTQPSPEGVVWSYGRKSTVLDFFFSKEGKLLRSMVRQTEPTLR